MKKRPTIRFTIVRGVFYYSLKDIEKAINHANAWNSDRDLLHEFRRRLEKRGVFFTEMSLLQVEPGDPFFNYWTVFTWLPKIAVQKDRQNLARLSDDMELHQHQTKARPFFKKSPFFWWIEFEEVELSAGLKTKQPEG